MPTMNRLTSSVLYIVMPTPPAGKSKTSCVSGLDPSAGWNVIRSFPGLVTTMSVARYWQRGGEGETERKRVRHIEYSRKI